MEITNEIKQKLIYQYFGQKYFYKNEFGTYGGIVGEYHTNEHIGNKFFVLRLRQLSEITEKDAIEVANICNGGNGTKEIHKYDYKNSDKAKFYIELKGEFEDDKNNTLIFFYEDGRFDKFEPNAGENGEHFDLSDWQTLSVYQFLESRGYDIPQYLLGGKTLKEFGLAIYK